MREIITNPESWAAGLVRTAIALVVLFAFWGAIAYSFWVERSPNIVQESEPLVVPLIQDIAGERFESRHFMVRNGSAAGREAVEALLETLEADYEAILAYQNLKPERPIQVVITDGTLPALANGSQLNLFYDRGVIHQDIAPVFLVLFSQGKQFRADINLFIALGFALYLSEEIGRAQGLGQSSDAWVETLQQRNALLPFDQAWEIEPPASEAELGNSVRALVQGGSFVRWVANAYGPDTVQALLNGQRLEDVTGLFFHEAQEDWLAALRAKDVDSISCDLAVSDNHFVQAICGD